MIVRQAANVLEIMEFQKSISLKLGHDVSEEEAASQWVREFAPHFPTIS